MTMILNGNYFGMDLYGILWVCMNLYGFFDFYMDISLFHF